MAIQRREVVTLIKCDWVSRYARFQGIRAFSCSIMLRAEVIPKFVDTSSPALNELLHTVRHQIFLPAYLPQSQRKLIFKQKYHNVLKADPPSVHLGDEKFQLRPSIPWKDIPNHWSSVLEALRLMEQDMKKWENFYPLMAGMNHAGKKWTIQQICKIIRIVGEQAAPHILLQILKRAEVVGITLESLAVIREIMWACRVHAVRNNWDEQSVSRALKCALNVGEILDSKLDSQILDDPRTQPDILGVVLELASARAALHTGCSDRDGTVKKYADRLVSNLDNGLPLNILQENLSLNQLDAEILRMIPLRNALLVAEKILGPEMPRASAAKAFKEKLDEPLRNVRSILHRGPKSLKSSSRRSPSWICDSQRFTQRRNWQALA